MTHSVSPSRLIVLPKKLSYLAAPLSFRDFEMYLKCAGPVSLDGARGDTLSKFAKCCVIKT